MIDDSYDSDFIYPHLDPPELNDLNRKPHGIKYIGEDKAVVERRYEVTGRGENYPWVKDIDYDPRFDEDQEDNFKEA